MIVPYVECAISRDRLFTVATHHTQNQSFDRAGAKNEKVMQGRSRRLRLKILLEWD